MLLHPDPRLLVCAPSNAAADVLALRLLEQLPQLAARMQATRDADVAADAAAAAADANAVADAGGGRGVGGDEGAGTLAAIEWACGSCTLLNAWSSAHCDACGARISAEENARVGRAVARAGAGAAVAVAAGAGGAGGADVWAAQSARQANGQRPLASTADLGRASRQEHHTLRRRWFQDETGDVSSPWASGNGWNQILRLNAQQRVGTPVELMKICAQDSHSDHFTVPPISALARKRVVICTCGAAHLLLEAGYPSSLWQARGRSLYPRE